MPLQAYFVLRNPLMKLLEEIMEIKGPQEHWHIYATGHSMGGSLATLLAYELSVSHPQEASEAMCTSRPREANTAGSPVGLPPASNFGHEHRHMQAQDDLQH